MLRDRYDSDKLFEQITALMPKMDPVLAKIDAYLEDEELFTLIREDLSRRHPQTLVTGRNSTPVEVILRMLVVKRLYSYSYEETERYVKDSLVLRQFCRLYLNPVPDDTTLIRQANLIRPETLEKFNARITELAQAAKITTGRKLRTDGTVVETNIHAPSDNRLLADGVRVLARTVKRARAACHRVAEVLGETFANSTRAAKQKSREIGKTLRQGGEEAQKAVETAYRELVEMTQKTVARAQQALALLANETDDQARRLAETLQTFLPRVEQVIRQTERRIFGQENVPAREKLVSLFEVHTDIIVRGKEGRPVEYGHKVWLDEVDGGIVSHYRILQGNPPDSSQWLPSLQAHQQQFGYPPEQASGDRGLYSADNEQEAKRLGVEWVILPKRGYRSAERKAYEQQDWFIAGRKWHAGVEGRISVLIRAHGLRRCLDHGQSGFARWVGWGVIAGNLAVMGRAG